MSNKLSMLCRFLIKNSLFSEGFEILKLSGRNSLSVITEELNIPFHKYNFDDAIEKSEAPEIDEDTIKILLRVKDENMNQEIARRFSARENAFILLGGILNDNLGAAYEKIKEFLETDSLKEYDPRKIGGDSYIENILGRKISFYDFEKVKSLFLEFLSDIDEVISEKQYASEFGRYITKNVVYDFGNGYTVVQIPGYGEIMPHPHGANPVNSFDRVVEGDIMGLCIGSKLCYHQDPKIKFFSIRDRSNHPHLTMSAEDGNVIEIVGKGNRKPDIHFVKMIKEFLENTNYVENYKNSKEFKDLPPVEIEGAKDLFNKDPKKFLEGNMPYYWYNNGIPELDSEIERMISEKDCTAIKTGLALKYPDKFYDLAKHCSMDIDSFYKPSYDQKLHFTWKVYRKEDWMIDSVNNLLRSELYFLYFGLELFRIDEFRPLGLGRVYDFCSDLDNLDKTGQEVGNPKEVFSLIYDSYKDSLDVERMSADFILIMQEPLIKRYGKDYVSETILSKIDSMSPEIFVANYDKLSDLIPRDKFDALSYSNSVKFIEDEEPSFVNIFANANKLDQNALFDFIDKLELKSDKEIDTELYGDDVKAFFKMRDDLPHYIVVKFEKHYLKNISIDLFIEIIHDEKVFVDSYFYENRIRRFFDKLRIDEKGHFSLEKMISESLREKVTPRFKDLFNSLYEKHKYLLFKSSHISEFISAYRNGKIPEDIKEKLTLDVLRSFRDTPGCLSDEQYVFLFDLALKMRKKLDDYTGGDDPYEDLIYYLQSIVFFKFRHLIDKDLSNDFDMESHHISEASIQDLSYIARNNLIDTKDTRYTDAIRKMFSKICRKADTYRLRVFFNYIKDLNLERYDMKQMFDEAKRSFGPRYFHLISDKIGIPIVPGVTDRNKLSQEFMGNEQYDHDLFMKIKSSVEDPKDEPNIVYAMAGAWSGDYKIGRRMFGFLKRSKDLIEHFGLNMVSPRGYKVFVLPSTIENDTEFDVGSITGDCLLKLYFSEREYGYDENGDEELIKGSDPEFRILVH